MPQYLPLEYSLLKKNNTQNQGIIETNFKTCCEILVQINILPYWHKKMGTEQCNFSNSPHRSMKSKPKEKNYKYVS